MSKANQRLNIYWYVRYGLLNLIDYIRYDVPQGLRNLLVYASVIWRTREWDQSYLFELMAFKLKQMELNHRRVRHISDWRNVAKQIQICRVSLERMVKDEYPGFVEFCSLTDAQRKNYNIQKFARDHIMYREDLERVCRELWRHSSGWWD